MLHGRLRAGKIWDRQIWKSVLLVLVVAGSSTGCVGPSVRGGGYGSQAARSAYGYPPPYTYGAATQPVPRIDPDPGPVATAPLPPLDPALAPAPSPSAVPAGKIPIAVLLPLTGANAALGQAFLDAAQLALFDLGDRKLALLPRDTGSTVEGASKAADSAVADGARLIIGPIVAGEVAAVKPIAQAAHVNVIAFSTDTQYAGDGTWLMGILPQQGVERVVGYAVAQGVGHFAALIPGTPYGQLVADTMTSAATRAGATVDGVESYDATANDVSASVKALAARGAFGAVMLPDIPRRLKVVAAQLAPNGVDPTKVHLLGSGLWDEPGLGQEPSLVGGWYAAPAPEARATFEKHYQDTYHRAPPRLATLSYDATGLAAVLARSPTPDFSADSLASPSGFTGADGLFRLMPDGTNQRGLAVMEVTAGGTRVVSPAPDSFAAVGQ